MTLEARNSKEELLRKGSWPMFITGAALIVYAKLSENSAKESNAKMKFYAREIESGRLNVDPTTAYLSNKYANNPQDSDYTGTFGLGILLLVLGLYLSRHSNKLRKLRTGE